jgi:aryl-alcohol dehydrogenase-like predicted oxidoreductase
MNQHQLGSTGPVVSALGLGCMGMSDFYGPADRDESIATVRAALDAGITLFDTGDFYGMGHNEMLIREALAGRRRDDYLLSVKFGALRDPARGWSGYDARPTAVRNFLAYIHCSDWVSTPSTSIGPRGSTRTCRSRTPSARSAT